MKERYIFALCNTFSFIVAAIFFGYVDNYFLSGILFFIATFIMIWGMVEEDER